MNKKESLFATREGSFKLMVIFFVLIIAFSLIAQVISTRGYKIAITDVILDVRGGDLHMELYRPANADSTYNLPCVLLTHGGSESLAADSMMAWELARRGFVVLNISAYGAGMSDQPNIMEDGTTGLNGARYWRGATMGVWDALQYAQSLAYVNPERIGVWGHSTGMFLWGSCVKTFGWNLTLNDRLLNILHDDFNLEITEAQLTQNADEIAKANLSETEMVAYGFKKAEAEKIVSLYPKAGRIIEMNLAAKVNVAGHEVIRDPQMNLIIGLGTHEGTGSYYQGETDGYKKYFYTGSDAVERNKWYEIPNYTVDLNGKSTIIGQSYDIDINNNAQLKRAIENNRARLFLSPVTMHNGILWSPRAVGPTIDFFCQSLGYNNGELSDASTTPIPTKSFVNYLTLIATTFATFSMVGLLAAFAAFVLNSKTFGSCVKTLSKPRMSVKGKDFILWVVATTIVGFCGAYGASMADPSFTVSNATMTKWMPWEPGQVRSYFQLYITAGVGVLLFFGLGLIFKKKDNQEGSLAKISEMNIGYGVKNVFKALAVAAMMFGLAYALADFINIFFDSRFLSVDGSFELMKSYSFSRTLRYAIIVLPATLVISTLNNMVTIKGVSDRADTAINVAVTSAGMVLFIFMAWLLAYSTKNGGDVLHLQCVLSIIPMVPMFNYLYRKLYKLTGSPWLGAFIVAILVGWRLAGYISHQFMWYGGNEVSAFWGIY